MFIVVERKHKDIKTYSDYKDEIERELQIGDFKASFMPRSVSRCNKCGMFIDNRNTNINMHNASNDCMYQERLLKLYMKGYNIVPSRKLANYLMDLGYKVIKKYVKGANDLRKEVSSGATKYFARSSAIYNHYYEVLPSMSGVCIREAERVKQTKDFILIEYKEDYNSKDTTYKVFKKFESGMKRNTKFKYTEDDNREKYLYDYRGRIFGIIVDEKHWPEELIMDKMLKDLSG